MPYVVEKDASRCPVGRPWAVKKQGTDRTFGCHPSRDAALKQSAALYANTGPEAKAAGEPPLNLRDADDESTECCETCAMFFGFTEGQGYGFCSGYSNVQVRPAQVCDSYEPDDEEAKSATTPEVPHEHVPDASREEPMTATLDTTPRLAANTREWRHERAERLIQMERRRPDARCVTSPLELRDETDDGIRVLRSYASLFNTPYSVRAAGYRYDETVRPGAFKRSLGRTPDVVFRLDHTGPPLARTSSGTLRLGEDAQGLWYEADLNTADPDVRALIPKLERGDLRESSFAFRCVKDAWNDDYTERDLSECELDRGDVAVVTFGASRATGRHMSLRSEERLWELRALGFDAFLPALVEWRNFTLLSPEQRAGKVLSSASMETLRAVLDLLADIDDAADEAQPMLADLMGVPNPDDDDNNERDEPVTDSEQLEHVRAESEGEGAEEERNDPTFSDYGIMSGLKQVKVDLALVKACQLADPDYQSDPDDASVMTQIVAAEAAVDQAIITQSKDGRMDDDEGRSEEDKGTYWDAIERLATESDLTVERSEDGTSLTVSAPAPATEEEAERSEESQEETETSETVAGTEEAERSEGAAPEAEETAEVEAEAEAEVEAEGEDERAAASDETPAPAAVRLEENDSDDLKLILDARRAGIR